MNWPPEVDSHDPTAKRLYLAVNREIERASPAAVSLARRIAEVFAYCEGRAASVSPDIEAGFMGELTGYLRAPVAALLDWSDAQLVEHVHANDGSETASRLAAAQATYHHWKHQPTEA
jgi:hypothetical protein